MGTGIPGVLGIRGGGVCGSQGYGGDLVPLTTHPHSPADHDPDILLLVLLPLVLVAALVAGGVGYSIYYRKKKIRQYRLQERQRQREMEARRPPHCSDEVATLNGSAGAAQP